MKLDVLSISGKSTGRSVDLPENIFGLEKNDHLLYLAVKQYLAAQRQGTHKAKEKGEVKASTRKIKKQKGTGTARAGSLKSPIFRGGGRVFGPRPDRNYKIKLNKKVKSLARATALSGKVAEGGLKVVEDFTFDKPKTKEFINVVNGLDVSAGRTLFVFGDYDKNVVMSGRNVPNASVVNAKDLNTYEILNSKNLIISESAINKLKEAFA